MKLNCVFKKYTENLKNFMFFFIDFEGKLYPYFKNETE